MIQSVSSTDIPANGGYLDIILCYGDTQTTGYGLDSVSYSGVSSLTMSVFGSTQYYGLYFNGALQPNVLNGQILATSGQAPCGVTAACAVPAAPDARAASKLLSAPR